MKKAIVTGSTSGIGREIGIRLLEKGFFVFFNYAHDDNKAKELFLYINELGYKDKFKIIKADFSQENSVNKFIDEIDLFNGIDVLVLNASSNGKKRNVFGKITKIEMEEMFQTNVFSEFFLIQGLFNYMNDASSILFVSSNSGIYPHSTYLPYGLTKSCQIFLSKMLVKELSIKKIRVNTIAPANIMTEMFPGNRSEDQLKNIKSKIALNRFGLPNEVARMAIEIIENNYVNGATICVDGGYDFK